MQYWKIWYYNIIVRVEIKKIFLEEIYEKILEKMEGDTYVSND
jgi:hypothetical protein